MTLNSYRLPNESEQSLKQQALQTWVADRARLLLQHPFTASLALHLELVPVVDSRVMTAATDGRRVFFNPLLLQTLTADQRLFVLAHEVWHCAARHFDRQLEPSFTPSSAQGVDSAGDAKQPLGTRKPAWIPRVMGADIGQPCAHKLGTDAIS
ncbi:MAG: M48 family metalloprotease [Marinospirillum sp.]|uniref:DUF2201 family putative metallopeptidase n=1 Tax=Marinospirillum sp. TaxID=2183934 RepID=UPI001A0FE865|nr:M48 family metalloprotease [Marinospirillum sp.]MBE0507045.1 M48 family metalloprotease [Marinospirillum sp.]